MIDITTTLRVKKDGQEDNLSLFGKIDEFNQQIELHYQMNSIIAITLDMADICGRFLDFPVAGTDASAYMLYGCCFSQQTIAMSTSGMGTLRGTFNRLIKQRSPSEKYDQITFTFEGIERMLPLVNFQIKFPDYFGPLSISRPALSNQEYRISGGITCSCLPIYHGIPSDPTPELQITQEKHIKLVFEREEEAGSLLYFLKRVKEFLEFLLSQEIQLASITFYNRAKSIHESQVISDSILKPHTFIKPITGDAFKCAEEELFNGLDGWLNAYDAYSKVISIWQKTIYNTNVSPEDIFMWRCQAFELLCASTEAIKNEAYSQLEPDQSNPNLRNYLMVVSSKYNIGTAFKDFFADVKHVRDKLTHNNPRKNVTSNQMRNAYALINYFLVSTMSHQMKFKCHLPGFFLRKE